MSDTKRAERLRANRFLDDYAKHWINDYLESKYDDKKYDCWDCFVQVQEEIFGVKVMVDMLNISAFENHDDAVEYIKTNPKIKNDWRELLKGEKPREGDAILFGYDNSATHIGIYIDSNRFTGVLHCSRKNGVILTNMQNIRNSLIGFKAMRYQGIKNA